MPARGSGTVGTAAYFQARVRVAENGCVEWTGTLSDDGYGKAVVGYAGHAKPIRKYAHRVLFEMWKGPIPTGLDLDHLCRNRRCVNPAHLEPVTRQENVARGILPQLMKDPSFHKRRPLLGRCKNGHAMAGENIATGKGRQKRRWCRACKRESARRARS